MSTVGSSRGGRFLISEVPLYRPTLRAWSIPGKDLRPLVVIGSSETRRKSGSGYRGTSLIRNNPRLEPYCSPTPRDL